MSNKCSICKQEIAEDFGKLKGTMLKVRGVEGRNEFIYVCSECQKKPNWIEEAKVRAV